ncbi:AAA family ATPase [Geodermatophilus sp. SYSU D01176]
MTTPQRVGALTDEQARNRRYLQWLEERSGRTVPIAVPASARWTGTGRPRLDRPTVQPIVGRVGLSGAFDDLGTDSFYVGPWRMDDGDVQVVSWAAPIADAYYGDEVYAPLAGKVQVTRSFRHRADEIIDFDDERHDNSEGPTAFDRKAPLRISRPPIPAPRPSAASAEAATQPAARPVGTQPQQPQPRLPVAPAKAQPTDTANLRHSTALRKALAAPRQPALQQVLATLQPRQHALVKWDPARPLIVQGHPGAGKTIVAIHRAAYLAHNERDGGPLAGRILLLGPTTNYVAHAQQALASLVTTDAVELHSLHSLLRTLLPDLRHAAAPGREDYRDYDDELATLVDKTAARLRAHGELHPGVDPSLLAQRLYTALKDGNETAPGEWAAYLRQLPDWKVARTQARFTPLLAYCALSARTSPGRLYEHMIIDEAQDVRPMEWRILARLNDGQGWTLLGDMNQRRSDCCYATWAQIATAIGAEDDEGHARVEDYRSVFRSTAAIQRFAGRLLPARERTGVPVQVDGDSPLIRKTTPSSLADDLVATTSQLLQTHGDGTLAAIAVDPAVLRRAFVTHGWAARSAGSDTYVKDGRSIRCLSPHDARGLEFDAVIVVDPADFPRNLGRHGLLYTSLTRANRSLAVLHTKRLPDELQRAVR